MDIDRDVEDQNRYLDGMVRVCGVLGPTLPALQAPPPPPRVCAVELLPRVTMLGFLP